MNYKTLLTHRITDRNSGWLDVRSDLLHFALITYALPRERLRPHIPDRFEIQTFPIGGDHLALMSAVPFLDEDFSFYRIAPFIKIKFAQTNYRVYVVDRDTGEPCVWFFGTTLGSRVVNLARWLWRIPWHYARYDVDCEYEAGKRAYARYRFTVASEWAAATVQLQDTGAPAGLLPGFADMAEQTLVLTHPVKGFFYRTDGKLGSYSVWHEEIPLTVGRAVALYFSLYERLGLLTKEEMARPHSVLICPKTTFEVHLPPKAL
ncbi:MAG TPA: DUF2071 domain-containing protein [Anaerolineales bacterium]|nr:DUF2071 domain-containing protein [Anaerolineales bacterium]